MDSRRSKRLMSAVIALLLLVYVGYQFYRTHHTDYKTETASYFTASDSLSVSGVAIRKETYVDYSGGGVVDYMVSTGDHIEKGGQVARVYATEAQATAQRNLESTESEIEKLKSLESAGVAYASDIDTVTGRINETLTGILSNTLSGDFTGASEKRDNILYLINEKQMIAGKVNNFDQRIKTLESRRDTYKSAAGSPEKKLVSPAAGYFVKDTDGLETAADYADAANITAAQVKALQSTAHAAKSSAAGKICGEYDWYFVCNVSADKGDTLGRLISGSGVQLNFPFVSSGTVPASVVAVNKSGSESAVVLECDRMDKALASIRNETAQIILGKYSGIRVSRDSVHFAEVTVPAKGKDGKTKEVKKNVMGVYVLNGSNIAFRQILPLFSTDSYVICEQNPGKDEVLTGSTVSLNDEVITEGTDLYDGKVVK